MTSSQRAPRLRWRRFVVANAGVQSAPIELLINHGGFAYDKDVTFVQRLPKAVHRNEGGQRHFGPRCADGVDAERLRLSCFAAVSLVQPSSNSRIKSLASEK